MRRISPLYLTSFLYTLRDDGTLQPSFDELGNVLSPDIVVKEGILCAKCQFVIRKIPPLKNGHFDRDTHSTSTPFYQSLHDLHESALQGCHLCAVLWVESKFPRSESMEAQAANHAGQDSSAIITFLSDKIYPPGMLEFKCGGSTGRFFAVGEYEERLDPNDLDTRFSVSNASDATYRTAIRWLDLCRRTHVTCNRVHSSVNRPPTRLIDIGPEGTLLLRLVYPQEPVEYLTLSHCWGKSHIICLLKANHEQLLRSIKQEHLPQLFKDAVSVTQRLGYRYLWIDSLCIIQDSPEDWESEASRMGSVYENSVCTIAAVSAPDSNSSLFTRYYPLYTNNYIMRDVTRGVRKIVTNLLERPEPLYKRAWALQERLVSPRLIEYGKNGISWHCREEIFLEPGIPVTHLSPLAESWNNLLCTHIGEDQTEGVRANIDPLINGQRGWMKLVGEYSEMKLTFESDRVHALKGVISVLQARRGLSFLAGVCQNFLPYSLLWRVKKPDSTTVISLDFADSQFPTWSCTFRTEACLYSGPIANYLFALRRTRTLFNYDTSSLCIEGHSAPGCIIEPFNSSSKGPVIRRSSDRPAPKADTFEIYLDFKPTIQMVVDFVPLSTVVGYKVYGCPESVHGLILLKHAKDDTIWRRVGCFFLEQDRTDGDGFALLHCFPDVKKYIIR